MRGGKYLDASSDSKCELCNIGRGSRYDDRTQRASEEWLKVRSFPDKELVGKIGKEMIEGD